MRTLFIHQTMFVTCEIPHVFEACAEGVRLNRTRGTGPIAQGLAMVLTHRTELVTRNIILAVINHSFRYSFSFASTKSYLKRLEGLMNV